MVRKSFVLFLLGLTMLVLPLLPATASATGTIGLGVYVAIGCSSGQPIDDYINMVGKTPAFGWAAITWQDSNGNYNEFNPACVDLFRTRGINPGVTWEPSKGPAEYNVNQPDFSWQSIINGKQDAYITRYAQGAAAYKYPFMIRVLHEMNGTWYPWGYGVNGNTNIANAPLVWQHIINIFRAAGATNVQFAYVVGRNDQGYFNYYNNYLKQAYPGDSYVDWVGIDGYNKDENNWRSLQDTFQPSYNFYTSISSRPVIIFETGSIESSTDKMAKANWITQGFLTTIPTVFPRVKIAAWMDAVYSGRDYSIDSSQNSLTAWQQVANNPLYQYP